MPSTSAPPPSPATLVHGWQTVLIVEHPEHYYPGGDVKFLIGHTLYQLHSDILLKHSGWYRTYCEGVVDEDSSLPPGWHALQGPFCTIYVHPKDDKAQLERPSMLDEQTGAIILEGVTVEEMDAYLAVLCPSDYITFGLSSPDAWKAVLKIAHTMENPSIHVLAVDRLDGGLGFELTSFERLILARQYGIEGWVIQALNALVTREAWLDPEEIAQMLPEDVARVTSAREDLALRQTPPALISIPEPEIADTENTERPDMSYVTARASSPVVETEAPVTVTPSETRTHPGTTRSVHLGAGGDPAQSIVPLSRGVDPGLNAPLGNRVPTLEGGQLRARRGSGLRRLSLSAHPSLG